MNLKDDILMHHHERIYPKIQHEFPIVGNQV